ncbi:MAG: hypothetical protein EOM54_03895 [Clostridia bacterium]|nr:hypothetical protein [Clostridia bacterium]
MMKKPKITVSGGGLLLLAALWFFLDTVTFFALILAVFVHEAGHIAALRLFGSGVKDFRADISGALISGRTGLAPSGELCCAAAGPVSGLLYAIAASAAGNAAGSAFLLQSAGISLVLSVFNLLPVFPLDGGRILSVLWRDTRACAAVSFVSAFIILLLGLWLLAKGMGAGLFVAGVWLMLGQAVL